MSTPPTRAAPLLSNLTGSITRALREQRPRLSTNLCARCARRMAHHRAFVALGSNVGDRVGNIERACRAMERKGVQVLRTSSLFQTRAMYVEDQADFLNGACEVRSFVCPLLSMGHASMCLGLDVCLKTGC